MGEIVSWEISLLSRLEDWNNGPVYPSYTCQGRSASIKLRLGTALSHRQP